MTIRRMRTDPEVEACREVMRVLRPHVSRESFLSRVRAQEASGYRLAAVAEDDAVRAVAGYRIGECLAWGRFLYVDDLVTDPASRSRGYGAALLDWLRAEARREGCSALHLDSGVQRTDAHRFYVREGMTHTSHHFVEDL